MCDSRILTKGNFTPQAELQPVIAEQMYGAGCLAAELSDGCAEELFKAASIGRA
jgi:hypothetical protein